MINKKIEDEYLIEKYSVVYRGGHPDYLKEKAGFIDFGIYSDRFELVPTIGSKKWFMGITIPYDTVLDVQIVDRTLSTFEGLFGGLNSRQLNQANNIHIKYEDENGRELLLRLEMLSGITVMMQAKKCLEFEDRLKVHGIRSKFKSISSDVNQQNTNDIPSQIEKLSQLRDKGIISAEEFQSKKMDLLSRM